MKPRIKDIVITDDLITAHLTDGRVISVPLVWSWRLLEATPEQRANYEIIGNGLGVHWPDVDEDISAEGMLYGMPASPLSASWPSSSESNDDNALYEWRAFVAKTYGMLADDPIERGEQAPYEIQESTQ